MGGRHPLPKGEGWGEGELDSRRFHRVRISDTLSPRERAGVRGNWTHVVSTGPGCLRLAGVSSEEVDRATLRV